MRSWILRVRQLRVQQKVCLVGLPDPCSQSDRSQLQVLRKKEGQLQCVIHFEGGEEPVFQPDPSHREVRGLPEAQAGDTAETLPALIQPTSCCLGLWSQGFSG